MKNARADLRAQQENGSVSAGDAVTEGRVALRVTHTKKRLVMNLRHAAALVMRDALQFERTRKTSSGGLRQGA